MSLVLEGTAGDLAVPLNGSVGVFVLSGKALSLDVVEGSGWHTSVASQVSVEDTSAIDQLLFSQRWECTTLDLEESFQDTGG